MRTKSSPQLVVTGEPSRKPIGQLLVEGGFITVGQVVAVLHHQAEHPDQRFGDIAVTMGFVARDDVERVAARQLEYVKVA